ncbi:acyl carrier protein [bacterium]|nr:acyl carrier protein [bacterium]
MINVKSSIASYFGVPETELSASTNFVEDLGADSLDMVELRFEFEELMETEIPQQAFDGCRIVGDVEKVIEDLHKFIVTARCNFEEDLDNG